MVKKRRARKSENNLKAQFQAAFRFLGYDDLEKKGGRAMKSKPIFKLLLDLAMTVLYTLLMFNLDDWGFFHEAAGLGILVMFGLHLWLNKKAFIGLWRKAQRTECDLKSFWMASLDVLLFVGMLITAVTGVLIAKTLFTIEVGELWEELLIVHTIASYMTSAILAAHLLIHMQYIAAVVKAWSKKPVSRGALRAIGIFGACALTMAMIYIWGMTAYQKGQDAQELLIQNAQAASTTQGQDTQTEDSAAIPSNKKKEDDESQQENTTETMQTPTLQDYLGKLYCTGCHRRCLLTNPHCAKGQAQAQSATIEYEKQYGDS